MTEKKRLQAADVSENFKDLDLVYRLYTESFPADEQVPWHELRSRKTPGRIMKAYYDHEKLVGMSYVFLFENIAYLGYLAVVKAYRGCGYGTEILQSVLEEYPSRIIAVDIETVPAGCEGEQKKRKDFYLHNHFRQTNIGCWFCNVDYELLSAHGLITAEEFSRMLIAHVVDRGRKAVFRKL